MRRSRPPLNGCFPRSSNPDQRDAVGHRARTATMSTNPIAPAEFPAAPANLNLPGPAGLLEAATNVPEPADARAGVAVICHPHPLQGGTMHNKVVTTLERSLRELGLATVVFNFRGTGASQGTFDDGIGET